MSFCNFPKKNNHAYWGFGFGMMLFCSCQYFKSTDSLTQEMVEEQWAALDKQKVTEYPLFTECDELDSKEQKKKCFFDTFHQRCTSFLKSLPSTTKVINDSLQISLKIHANGTVEVLKIEGKPEVLNLLPEDFKLNLESIKDLQAAQKEGIPVAVKMQLPIVIKTQ